METKLISKKSFDPTFHFVVSLKNHQKSGNDLRKVSKEEHH
jgi:hypothetical protein